MTVSDIALSRSEEESWLKRYYFTRALVSVAWVGSVFAFAREPSPVTAVLLTAYPAWDALANVIDASKSGGLQRNPTQAINAFLSLVTAIAVAVAVQSSMAETLIVFGFWAIVAGVLQLATAARRWKSYGAQWAMVLSGAQSALAGTLFLVQSNSPNPPSIKNIMGYATVGAIYFLISAIWLTVRDWRRQQA
jgi:uncharacterized membrane protein HdeD (DUF308 family)